LAQRLSSRRQTSDRRMTHERLLAIENLKVSFPAPMRLVDMARLRRRTVKAVAGVDLIVGKGETLGLVGESGCGKSTLSRAVVGLTPIESGRVLLEGEDVASLRGERRKAFPRRVQMVFQEPHASLNPRLTIGETLAEVFHVHRVCPPRDIAARVTSLLATVGLPAEFAARRPRDMSGGQCQRVGIARALALEPDLIIADEVVSALDVSIQAQILNLFMELRETHKLALLFVSHDLTVVRHFCQRVAVMYLGQVVEVGPTDVVLRSPRHPYTKALLASIPEGNADALSRSGLSGEPPSPQNPPSGCAFHPRCPSATELCSRLAPPPQLEGAVTFRCHHPEPSPPLLMEPNERPNP
jgi:peptide/nickel transport system ATP-binding protein